MRLLLDTHLLLWAAEGQLGSHGLSHQATALISDPSNEVTFSAASIWEVAIKSAQKRADFAQDPGVLRRGLLESGYSEIPVRGEHALAVGLLPPIHGDPFDRLLIAQALVEEAVLLTADAKMVGYGPPVRRV